MKKLTQFLAATLAGVFAVPALQADVIWTSEYTGVALPNEAPSDPLWTLDAGGAGQSASVSGGILTISADNALTNYRYYKLTGGSGLDWDPSAAGSTLEVRMKVNSISYTYAQKLTLQTGTANYAFAWTDNSFQQVGGAYAAVDSLDFHVYRFVIDGTDALSLYIDNDPTPVFSGIAGSAVATSGIYFGNLGWGNEGGVAEWDYIKWTNAGAFAPVPEPASLALLGLAAGALLLRRKRQA